MHWFDVIKLEEITKAPALTAEDEKKIQDRMKFRNESRNVAEKAVRRKMGKVVRDTKRSLSDRVRGVLNPSGEKRTDSFARARREAELSRLRPNTQRPTRLRPKTPKANTRKKSPIFDVEPVPPKTKPTVNVKPAPNLAQMAKDKRIKELTRDLEFQAQ